MQKKEPQVLKMSDIKEWIDLFASAYFEWVQEQDNPAKKKVLSDASELVTKAKELAVASGFSGSMIDDMIAKKISSGPV